VGLEIDSTLLDNLGNLIISSLKDEKIFKNSLLGKAR
jgi:hypothetical protein